jgi:pimeloyl-ACP methyl ester carboxylesterase
MPTVSLPPGQVEYHDAGSGPPIVLLHGLLVNGSLWNAVVPLLSREHRVIVPELPLGCHRLPLAAGAPLAPPDVARLVADLLAALDLGDVTLVGNDTGGAIAQLVAAGHPERVGRLVLTPCDAYENFLPPMFRPLQILARIPGAVFVVGQSLRPRLARRLPFAYGWLAKRRIPDDLSDAWMAPLLSSRAIRGDVAAILKGISNRYTLDAATHFGEFTKPVLIAWAPEDRFFKLRYAERMLSAFPNARLERIEDSLTFVSLDQPARTAALIAAFAGEAAG